MKQNPGQGNGTTTSQMGKQNQYLYEETTVSFKCRNEGMARLLRKASAWLTLVAARAYVLFKPEL
jgi:hypothetical protein